MLTNLDPISSRCLPTKQSTLEVISIKCQADSLISKYSSRSHIRFIISSSLWCPIIQIWILIWLFRPQAYLTSIRCIQTSYLFTKASRHPNTVLSARDPLIIKISTWLRASLSRILSLDLTVSFLCIKYTPIWFVQAEAPPPCRT